ncbi:MAG: YdcF family protein [Actinobacteria bacterium]|nr:YdcF family protein [Actinomycetota bacterium]
MPVFTIFRWVRRIFYLAVLLAVLYFIFTFVQVWSNARQTYTGYVQAIVVMGAPENGGKASPEMIARLQRAMSLWQQRTSLPIVVTGGKLFGHTNSESQVESSWLQSEGLPSGSIISVGGVNDWSELYNAYQALKPSNYTDVAIVSDSGYESYLEATAASVGLTGYPYPTNPKKASLASVAEGAAMLAVGRIIGYHSVSQVRAFL